MKISNRNIINALMCLYFFLSSMINLVTAEGSRMGGFILLGIVTIILVLYLFETIGKIYIRFTFFHATILIFALFCMLSSTWAIRKSWALNKGIDILEIFITMSIMYCCYQDETNMDDLLKIIMYGCYAIVIYAYLYYGWSSLFILLKTSTRISNEAVNANVLGIYAAYAITINLYYILYSRTSIRDILIIPSILILAVSGSRKALVVVIAGVIGVFVLKNWNNKKILQSAIKMLFALIIAIMLLFMLSRLPIFANINKRMLELINIFFGVGNTRSNTAWIRFEYNRLGLRLFKSRPLLGIGIGSANVYTQAYYGHDHYLHNNYIELLACGGIVGFAIYYTIFLVILLRFIKYRRARNNEYDILFVLFLIVLVMDYGMVTYYDKPQYIFLMLFWLESEVIKREGKVLYGRKAVE